MRPPVEDDLEALHHIFSQEAAMAYWSHPAHTSLSRTQETLDGMIASHAETGLEFVIEHSGQLIGKAGLWRLAEIGYIIHPDFWRRGFAWEALNAIIQVTWKKHPALPEITAEIDPRNDASKHLLARLGFRLTHSERATIKINGEWCDSDYFALARPQNDDP
nr:GNAT family N-acetyltransferase [Aliiroseovarius sp. F20344]